MSERFESFSHFGPKKKKKKKKEEDFSVPQRCLPSAWRLFFVVIGNSPAAIKKLISGGLFCTVSPHLERLLMYVGTQRKENTLKVRLKLEPFHHEALWEVPCI